MPDRFHHRLLAERPELTDVAVPLRVRRGDRELAFFSMTAVVGAPLDVTVAEVAIESFYPADAETAEALEAIGERADAPAGR